MDGLDFVHLRRSRACRSPVCLAFLHSAWIYVLLMLWFGVIGTLVVCGWKWLYYLVEPFPPNPLASGWFSHRGPTEWKGVEGGGGAGWVRGRKWDNNQRRGIGSGGSSNAFRAVWLLSGTSA